MSAATLRSLLAQPMSPVLFNPGEQRRTFDSSTSASQDRTPDVLREYSLLDLRRDVQDALQPYEQQLQDPTNSFVPGINVMDQGYAAMERLEERLPEFRADSEIAMRLRKSPPLHLLITSSLQACGIPACFQNIGGDNTAATDVDGGLRLYSGPQSGIGLPWEAKDPGQLCLIATDDPVSLLKDPAMHACNSKAVNQALSYATREGTRFALIIKRHYCSNDADRTRGHKGVGIAVVACDCQNSSLREIPLALCIMAYHQPAERLVADEHIMPPSGKGLLDCSKLDHSAASNPGVQYGQDPDDSPQPEPPAKRTREVSPDMESAQHQTRSSATYSLTAMPGGPDAAMHAWLGSLPESTPEALGLGGHPLGRGSSGAIVVAGKVQGCPAAIKVYEFWDHLKYAAGFKREASALQRLKGAAYCSQLQAFGTMWCGREGFIALPISRRVLQRWEDVQAHGRDALRALDCAHSRSIGHKDLHPTAFHLVDCGDDGVKLVLADFDRAILDAEPSMLVEERAWLQAKLSLNVQAAG